MDLYKYFNKINKVLSNYNKYKNKLPLIVKYNTFLLDKIDNIKQTGGVEKKGTQKDTPEDTPEEKQTFDTKLKLYNESLYKVTPNERYTKTLKLLEQMVILITLLGIYVDEKHFEKLSGQLVKFKEILNEGLGLSNSY